MAEPSNSDIWDKAKLDALSEIQKHRNLLFRFQGHPEYVGVKTSTGRFTSRAKINSEILRLQDIKLAKKALEPPKAPTDNPLIPEKVLAPPVVAPPVVAPPVIAPPVIAPPIVAPRIVAKTDLPNNLDSVVWTKEKLDALSQTQNHRNLLFHFQGKPELKGHTKTGKFTSRAKINTRILELQAIKLAKPLPASPVEEEVKAEAAANTAAEEAAKEVEAEMPQMPEMPAPAEEKEEAPAEEEEEPEQEQEQEQEPEPEPEPEPEMPAAPLEPKIPIPELIYKDIDSWSDDRLLQYDKTNPIPQDWIKRREEEYGLYPDISDPNFAARLAKKTEFYELKSDRVAEDSCQNAIGEFTTTSIQRLVARFLHPDTPYNGALLYHGVGVGKTCSAITVAETFLELMPYNKVYIIAPQAIQEGFHRTIFDVNRLTPSNTEEYALTKEFWKSPQCTGMTYLHLSDTANNRNKEEIVKEVNKVIKQRYEIKGYLEFANLVTKQFDKIPEAVVGVAREDSKREIINRLFADHLIIIDEAHNLRDANFEDEGPVTDEPDLKRLTEKSQGKKLTPILKDILSRAEGLRLMLMTATPMYNTAPEIIFLLNLLTLNDTKDDSLRLDVSEVFQGDGQFKEGGESKLKKRIKRYVSYMRGENPNTFPLRLTPDEANIAELLRDDKYPKYSISRKEMKKGDQTDIGLVQWADNDKNIMARLPLWVHDINSTWVGTNLHRYLKQSHTGEVDESDRGSEVTDFILDRTMQMGNIFYKNGTYGGEGWSNHFKESMTTFNGTKVKQYRWIQATTENTNTNTDEVLTIQDIFGKGLSNYAPKIAAIVDCIERGKGISFVYSRYIKAGALPIGIALELRGWVRVLSDGTPAPLLIQEGATKPTKFYILLTSDEGVSPDFQGLLRYATIFKNKEEVNGSKVKAIIGSQIASEGLDLKCIRQIHLLDGWYHLNRIEQIEGRGVRFCSHVDLPLAERNCLIYLHAANVENYETADLYAYRLGVRKAQPIGRVSRLMKIEAWDCILNLNAIILKGLKNRPIIDAFGEEKSVPLRDEPFTSLCDFVGERVAGGFECKPYKCDVNTIDELGSNKSTQKSYNFRRDFLEKQQKLIDYFKTETVMPVEDVLDTFYKSIPDSFAEIGLREVINKVRIHRDDGIYGTLKLINNYIVFQPEGVTDAYIPMAFRYGRAYGRIPGAYDPPRGTLLATEGLDLKPIIEPRPAAAVTTAAAAATTTGKANTNTDENETTEADTALEKLREWDLTLTQILETNLTGPISDMDKSLVSWRWVFRFFRNLKNDVRPIAYHWFMENYWTYKEQLAVFTDWLTRGINTLNGYEKTCAEMFMKDNKRIELFQRNAVNRISGCVIYNLSVGSGGSIETYCQYGSAISKCTTISKDDVAAIIGKPVNLKEDTGPYFGFLVSKQKRIIFKTVDKVKGDMRGAECANTSNLGNHQDRVIALHNIFRAAGDPISGLLLGDEKTSAMGELSADDVRKERQKALDYVKKKKDPAGTKEGQFVAEDPTFTMNSADPLKQIGDLSLKQICPYMEFLLRYADRHGVGGKRWFMSVVDSARAGVKMT